MDLATLLEGARKALGISGREAARRANISESRWRGVLQAGTAPARTVVAMALAVGADPAEALAAAGLPGDGVETIAADLAAEDQARESAGGVDLADEIERVRALQIPPEQKIRITKALIRMWEERSSREPANGAV